MDGSVGKALRDARLGKNLTVEEVSRLTKIRPDRITDIENDEYTRFPNLAYARSFLVLYAKFIGVDISKYPTVEVGSSVGVGDYQYLRREEAPKHQRYQQDANEPPKKPRWLILFFLFLAMLAFGALAGWGVMTYLRLGPVENLVKKDTEALSLPTPTAPTPSPKPTPAPTPLPASPQPSSDTAPSLSVGGAPLPGSATAAGTPTPASATLRVADIPVHPAQPANGNPAPSPGSTEPEVRRAMPVNPENSDDAMLGNPGDLPAPPPAETPASTFPPKGAVREIKVSVTKRTRVRIVKDNLESSSLYSGYMNPAMKPQSFKGRYFWITTADPSAVIVTIDGQPAKGPDAGVEMR